MKAYFTKGHSSRIPNAVPDVKLWEPVFSVVRNQHTGMPPPGLDLWLTLRDLPSNVPSHSYEDVMALAIDGITCCVDKDCLGIAEDEEVRADDGIDEDRNKNTADVEVVHTKYTFSDIVQTRLPAQEGAVMDWTCQRRGAVVAIMQEAQQKNGRTSTEALRRFVSVTVILGCLTYNATADEFSAKTLGDREKGLGKIGLPSLRYCHLSEAPFLLLGQLPENRVVSTRFSALGCPQSSPKAAPAGLHQGRPVSTSYHAPPPI